MVTELAFGQKGNLGARKGQPGGCSNVGWSLTQGKPVSVLTFDTGAARESGAGRLRLGRVVVRGDVEGLGLGEGC